LSHISRENLYFIGSIDVVQISLTHCRAASYN